MLWVRISIRARCTTLCDKVCQWHATGRWFSPGPSVPSTNKTDKQTNDINKISHSIILIVCFNTFIHLLTLGLYVPLIGRFKSLLFMWKLLQNTLIYSNRTALTIFLKRKRVVGILSQYILYLYQIALYISRPSTLYSSCDSIEIVDFSTLYRCTIFSTLNIKTD